MVTVMAKALTKLTKPLDWNDQRLIVTLNLIFAGRLSQARVAENVGVSTRTVERWVAHPDFQARLSALRADFAASIRDVTYADKARRIIALDQMAEAARVEFETRPLLREVRPTRDGEVVNEAFNRDAHAAFRDALDDIAKEMGHRQSKVDVTSAGEKLTGIADLVGALLGTGNGSGGARNDGTAALEEARIVDALDELAARADRGAGR